MCEALVDGWVSNWAMGRVVAQAWINSGKDIPDDQSVKFKKAETALKVKNVYAHMPCKQWMPRNMERTNEALWNDRPRVACVAMARRELGIHAGDAASITVGGRREDKRRDWKTVK